LSPVRAWLAELTHVAPQLLDRAEESSVVGP